ncbi:Putative poly-gamma-glutamate biosynthesis protein [Ignavibacterium album JCM 16511]|uniref:Putative poly-gamma-glutamate biosynthesis protein n=1 Tax=Ignavibacterium album (strain DSM 19864 / JCM 16511 / NBRC 101810 / Mat9-16) TaxID=945713 RepID=I0AJM0_IGNAJ|nr:CapA family protein [Ignavibacterium album]AFH49177.1 Putative poly-gamma-glutamate biosynthesis protein [Ignavibacterium album JCM 16511]
MIKFFLLITSFLISYFISRNQIELSDFHNSISTDSIVTLRIAVVGDLMCHSPQYNYAKVAKDSFDFNPVYRFIKPYLEQADFTFGNLETVIGNKGSIYSGYPRFKSPTEYVSALSQNGFDFVCFANNHTLDQGESGVLSTIEILKQNNIGYTGAFVSQSDRDSVRIFKLNEIKTAILAYSYGTNASSIPKGKNYLINLINLELIQKDILKARESGAEIVLVNYHFGNEYQRLPSEYQKEVVKKTIALGADIITASHPHVIQPAEFFKTHNAKLDTGIVAYSLGNFISNQINRFTDAGVILYLNLEKNLNSNQIKISSVEYIPTWVFKGRTERGNEYLTLPINDETFYQELPFLTEIDKAKIKQAKSDTDEIITYYIQNIKLYRH